jgi:D-glycero-beta-D-manno-heptose 1-phosphate adenylyltransferase
MTRFEFIQTKIVSKDEAKRKMAAWKLKGEKVCFTNGCFDILHFGHINYLSVSADKGNRLIVALNSDESIRALNKAENRPINSEEARMHLIAALGFVDLVLLFKEQTPLELIKLLEPDILVKGADYDANETRSSHPHYIVGTKEVLSYGGSVCTVEFVPGYSTTAILNRR